MKIEINQDEQKKIAAALNTQLAAIRRSINTEKDEEIRKIREIQYNSNSMLLNKLMTGEIK